jgi:hypothetical protein
MTAFLAVRHVAYGRWASGGSGRGGGPGVLLGAVDLGGSDGELPSVAR